MSPQKKSAVPKMPKPDEESKAYFKSLVPERADVRVKPMFGQLAAFVNGNMFMGLYGAEVFVRLPDTDRQSLMTVGGGPFEPMPGRPMREYIVLPSAWRDEPKRVRQWVDRSLTWAQGLPPK
ncbi:MAG TPA: TfoX/Sxy family protein [Actinomycetota bacterium]|nr:TfoX/Sxy family protein [Actinomycetota bacterium]